MNIQVDPKHYIVEEYDTRERFVNYWYQIYEVLTRRPRNVLEIGIGNGFTSRYLRSRDISVIRIDIDGRLCPDIVGSIISVPCRNDSFDVIVCCEVLEHLPFSEVKKALSELCRVSSGYVVISLPDAGPVYRFYLHIPKIKTIKRLISLPRLSLPTHSFDGQHYWAVGKKGSSLSDVLALMRSAGFRVEKTYRVFEDAYRRFFILRKETPADAH